MTALELYDPVFQFICETSRLTRSNASLSIGELRRKADRLLDEIEDQSKKNPSLFEHVQKVHVSMKHFIDSVIVRSILESPYSEQWHENRLGYEDSRDGDQAFFDYLDNALNEPPSPQSAERLHVYYTCLGLGFQGIKTPDELKNLMERISPRIQHFLTLSQPEKLSPGAYQGLDERDLVKPPQSKRLATIAAVLCLILATIALYDAIYHRFNQSIPDEIRQILGSSQDVEPWTKDEEGSAPASEEE